jgi:hypothetical protein
MLTPQTRAKACCVRPRLAVGRDGRDLLDLAVRTPRLALWVAG